MDSPLAGLAAYTREHTSQAKRVFWDRPGAVGDVFERFSTTPLLAWGRVIPDTPDYCREFVAALAEQ
jgi:hypothetical protein